MDCHRYHQQPSNPPVSIKINVTTISPRRMELPLLSNFEEEPFVLIIKSKIKTCIPLISNISKVSASGPIIPVGNQTLDMIVKWYRVWSVTIATPSKNRSSISRVKGPVSSPK